MAATITILTPDDLVAFQGQLDQLAQRISSLENIPPVDLSEINAQLSTLSDINAKIVALTESVQELRDQLNSELPVEPPVVADPTTLTDPAGNVWTIDSNSRTLKNGVIFGGGIGSEYRLVDSNVQVLGSDNNWYQVQGDSWVLASTVTPTDPVEETPPTNTTPSPVVIPTVKTRSRNVPLPQVVNSPASLIAGKKVLPYSKSIALGNNPLPTYSKGSYAQVGLTPYQPTTGERQELGIVTQAQADWISGGSPNNMLVQAEAHGDIPIHYGLINVFDYPNATTYSADVGSPFVDITGYPVTPDLAHHPELCYVPYLATGDKWYLQGIQASANYCVMTSPPAYRFLLVGQPRAFAWLIRSLTYAYLTAPTVVETGDNLFPKSYWKALLDKYRDEFDKQWVQNTNQFTQNTRAAITGNDTWLAPWEQDYLGVTLGFMVYAGLEDWRSNYIWHVQQAIRRAAFGSRAIGYHWMINSSTVDFATLIAANTEEINDGNYRSFWRADLKIAMMNGIAGADAAFTVADNLAKSGNYISLKYAV